MDTYNKAVVSFADDLIFHYSKYDQFQDCHTINMSDVPEIDLCRLSAIIMENDPMVAAEATGPDNPRYETAMLPALTEHLSNPSDPDLAFRFSNCWREGVLAYNYRAMEALLNDRASGYEGVMGYEDDSCDIYRMVSHGREIECRHADL